MKCFAFKICFLAVLVLGFNSSGFAQITSDGTPHSFTKNVKKSAGFTTIPDAPGDWEQVMISQTPGTKPYLFGWPVKVSIDVIDPDNLVYEDDRYVIYQLNILSSEAYSQNIIFDNYYLPDGVQVYLYDPELTIINGAYTSINNKESGLLATSPIPGNQLVVEVNIDKGIGYHLVGLPDKAVSESSYRISAALNNNSYKLPGKKIIINSMLKIYKLVINGEKLVLYIYTSTLLLSSCILAREGNNME